MRKLFNVILLILIAASAFGQNYGNSWINFNQDYFKIEVYQNGIYRIPYSTLNTAISNLSGINGSQFTLYHNGEAQRIYVSTSGVLSANDYIEFWGERNDGEPDKLLFKNADEMPNSNFSFFSDTSAYFLTWNNLSSNPRIVDFINDLSNLPPKESFIWNTVSQSYQKQFIQGIPYSTFSSNLYNALYEKGEGFYDNDYTSSKTYTINTPNVAGGTSPISSVTTVVASWSTGNHHLKIDINGIQLYDTTFSGYHVNDIKQTTATSNLQSSNSLLYSALAAGTDRNAVGLIEITYPRNLNLNNESNHFFTLDGNGLNRKYLEFNNFNDKGQPAILYDLTNGFRITSSQAPGSNPLRFALPISLNSRDCYLRADDPDEYNEVTELGKIQFINFNNAGNQGDYIIISHPKLFNDSNGFDWVEEYRKYRDQNENPEAIYQAITININQLYDQFSYGIRKHPLAVKNFANFAADNWQLTPRFVFLIGKGSQYNEMRLIPAYRNQCLIPTYGNPASDNLLTSGYNSDIPRIPVGRLSANVPDDVRKYLGKIQQYELQQSEAGDFFQTAENKLWMKKILHFGGGTSKSEQELIKSYLESYEEQAKKPFAGVTVDSFYKKSTSPIANVQSEYLKEVIDNGVSMITFFGHSSPGSFDISIDDPENYTNTGKYPLLYSNGCFAGYIYGTTPGISERFVLAEDKGAIGFLSTTGLSISVSLDIFATEFYRNFSKDEYAKPLGDIIRQTIIDVDDANNNIYTEMVTHEMTLHGDPAIRLNQYEKEDYAVEPSGVRFEPSVVSAVIDSFEVFIDVYNLGKAVNDSFDVRLTRILGNGAQELYQKRVKAPYYKSTVRFVVPTIVPNQTNDDVDNTINTFKVQVDASNELNNEISEINNTIPNAYFPEDIRLTIIAEDVFPVSPYNFGIVGSKNVILKASTSNPFSNSEWYLLELDTSKLFNSPFKQSTETLHPGGLIQWPVTLLNLDSAVYYWRVARDTSDPSAVNWHNASFVYLENSSPGWNQSHHFQFQENEFANIYVDSSSRKFLFVDDVKEIEVTTGVGKGVGGNLPDDELAWTLNGIQMHRWRMGGCGGLNGLTFAVIDETSGLPWSSINSGTTNFGPYGNHHCSFQYFEQYGFNFTTTGIHPELGIQWSQVIANFLDSIPDGHYILMYTHNQAPYTSWDNSLVTKLVNLGAISVLPLSQGGFQAAPYIFFTQKGNATYPNIENVGTAFNVPITENVIFSGVWNEGYYRTELIGPAKKWDRLLWKKSSIDDPETDITSMTIFGVENMNSSSQTKLATLVLESDTSLLSIDAEQYPYLRLEFRTKDDINRTPAQLEYWRIMYEEAPDVALHPDLAFEFSNDTLDLGAPVKLKVAAENVSMQDMDPLLVKFSILNAQQSYNTSYIRFDAVPAGDTIEVRYEKPTLQSSVGNNVLTIELNPDRDQAEKHHFNNIGILNYKVVGDIINPLLDVTFDGKHILDGEIVSSTPYILITLRDENDFLLLDDTSSLEVSLKNPDGSIRKMHYVSDELRFYPGTINNNTAKAEFTPTLTDEGVYQLIVRDEDRSGNRSGKEYKIHFEIIITAGLGELYNYPNPVTTSTQFVFTLTGTEIPEQFKIQIINIEGDLVKEISREEIGDLRIGTNFSDYQWSGEDQNGSQVANGVYFYRVVSRYDNEEIENLQTGVDLYLEKGIGKMILMR